MSTIVMIVVCGVLGVLIVGIRVMDYVSFKQASELYMKSNKEYKWTGNITIRIVMLSLVIVLGIFFFILDKSTENRAVYILLILMMVSEIINSMTNYRTLISPTSILIKNKVVKFKSIREISKPKSIFHINQVCASKPKLAGMSSLKTYDNMTYRVPNPLYKVIKNNTKGL